MKERGVVFQPNMALAAHEGVKTNTRRIIHPQPFRDGDDGRLIWSKGRELTVDLSPYGVPGDRLWVREPWRTATEYDHLSPIELSYNAPILPIGGTGLVFPHPLWGRYRHAHFMCRWMSRTLLEIVDVRIERLRNISEADAIAEGLKRTCDGKKWETFQPAWMDVKGTFQEGGHVDPRDSYRWLWDSINGEGAWDANPYVWVVVFKRLLNG